MIRIVAGDKGEGKTKQLIDMANESVRHSKGHIVFIDNSNRHMYDLNHKIRFISASDFTLKDYNEFYGFVCGIMSEDHDIHQIYFDSLLKLANVSIEESQTLIEKLKSLSDRYNVEFIISICCLTKDLPENLKEFFVA